MRCLITGFVAACGLAATLTAANAGDKPIRETITLGRTLPVWATMCKDTFCSEGVCLTFRDTRDKPARVIVHLESTWPYKSNATEQVGKYCTSKWMTYFMTYRVSVQALDGDVVVSGK
jgi:hypothetical protein